jgi:hypothetical protein
MRGHGLHLILTGLIVGFLAYAADKDARVAAPDLGDELDQFLAGLLQGVTA